MGYNKSSDVSNCYATGNVSGNSSTGGLVGYNYIANLSNCYATGNVSGNSSTGGLIGVVDEKSSVNNCYATGRVSGGSIGGLIDDNTGNVNTSYWNTQSSGVSTSNGGTGLTTAQMKQQASFSGWDFANVWTITEGESFPRLRSVYNMPMVFIEDFTDTLKINSEYKDTVTIIKMDNLSVTLSLEDHPVGMALVQDSIVAWQADETGTHSFTIVATDGNGYVTKKQYTLKVHNFEGQGTESDPYRVSTIEQLNMVKHYPGNYFILVNDLDFEGTAYDSVNSANGWEPIGNIASPFTGSFNGKGHSIKNLYINRSSEDYVGLFGRTYSANIDSVRIENCKISGNYNTGGLAGQTYNSAVSNCYVTGNISGNFYTGGLIGRNSSSNISKCYVTVNVSGNNYIGGLTGENNSTTIDNCYSTGNVSGNEEVGGLFGRNNKSDISNSYSLGDVSGNETTGGLTGYNYSSSTITNCFSVGSVSGNSNTGGLVGNNSFSSVTNSYYNTETSGQSDNSSKGTPKTTAEMKLQSTYTGWDFGAVWSVAEDNSYPGLQALNNAPFAFRDTFNVAKSIHLDSLLLNDYDIETARNSLVLMVEDIRGYGIVSGNWFVFDDTVTAGHKDTLMYRTGEKRAQGDTLWGGHAMAFLSKTAFTTDLELTDIIVGPELSAETSVRVTVKNVNSQPVSNIEIGIVYRDTSFTETYTGALSPGDSNEYLFSHTIDCTSEGIFDIKSEIKTPDDNMMNNTRVEQVHILKLTYTADLHGSISGTSPQVMLPGSNGSGVEAVPNTGYHFTSWSDGNTDNPRTDTNITKDTTVTAGFAINTYTLTYNAGSNGSISGASPQTVEHGSDGAGAEAIPDANYHFVNWSDGSTENPRTDINVTADITVTANFAIDTYTLTYLAGTNGSISGTTPQTIDYGSSGSSVEAIPNTGYHFVNWSDGSTDNPRTDVNVTANITVTASFAINTYTLTYMAGENGSISGTSPQTVEHGSDGVSVEAVPNANYRFVEWSDGSIDNPRTDVNVTENISVTATFEPVTSQVTTYGSYAVSIYPVPASTMLHIEAPEEMFDALSVINIYGQILVTKTGNISGTINISDLPKGIYYVVLKGKSHEEKRKILVY